MQLNHTNLPVTDVRSAREFFEEYFGFQHVSGTGNVVVLMNEDNFALALTPSDAPLPDGFHVGFFVDDNATVDEIYQ